ncbi:nucleotide kinase domain-containing protein [Sphingobacterium corticibacter]|uniref:5-hmdU DNA kinase helical domain-containing protein n=1 Tax=Sphingobacterium corticibacter TaxID=2171749 RepID=A0A2T8HH12_9SPHI|nr:nucleotide kinase domain-containing protein [Sphingobacterium corticibacter]PVH24726.1 hypothetical protein DC487_11390 [Sphingobacterium corticibacter]
MKDIYIKKQLPTASKVLDTYWKFACERQNIFFKRISRKSVLTNDEILIKHKFTNAYRASDRVSQYLIKNVIRYHNQNHEDTLFRILLFKLFNKISTWELLESELGDLTWREYSFDKYNNILLEAMKAKEAIYSGAYIMASGKSYFGYQKKHENHLRLLEHIVKSGFLTKLQGAKSMEDVFHLLLSFPTIGTFLAYQYTIDLNYSELINFSEMDFVYPGPGAKDGIKKCFTNFGDYTESDIIRYVTDIQYEEFDRLGVTFCDLWGRSLQLIDCQNLFCETDKYARVAHPEITGISNRMRIKQIYSKNYSDIEYYYPPKWGINHKIPLSDGKTNKNNLITSRSM